MKKVVLLVLFLSILLPATVFGAEQGINVYIDGVKLQFTSKPIQENGTTLVPLRTIFEGLGANVKWDAKTQTVIASKNGVNIEIKLGQKFATRDGKRIPLTTKPRTILGVTYVPLRFIGESFGNTIEVKGKEIYIISPEPPSFEYEAKDSSVQAGTTPNQTTTPAQSGSNVSVQEIGKLSNRVVYIETYDASNKPLATGSGIVVSSDGKILTNFHVIDGASSVKIEFND
ncbi:stalk domain-containing protein [Paenibacillus sp. SN-8-1]|uniref:copper amine oxidase N-terminal domain-containing protein n=1 Tax=Paenibacillus sp. SN-8-1 TaxID=3435409 RepID=UPI003D9A674E